MNAIKIFKLDAEIIEDVFDVSEFLLTTIKEIVDAITNNEKDVGVDVVYFEDEGNNDYCIITFKNFIVLFRVKDKRFDIIDIDFEEKDIHVYNLYSDNTKMLKFLDIIMTKIVNLMNISTSHNVVHNYTANVNVNSFLFNLIKKFPKFNDITEYDISEICDWLNIQKNIH